MAHCINTLTARPICIKIEIDCGYIYVQHRASTRHTIQPRDPGTHNSSTHELPRVSWLHQSQHRCRMPQCRSGEYGCLTATAARLTLSPDPVPRPCRDRLAAPVAVYSSILVVDMEIECLEWTFRGICNASCQSYFFNQSRTAVVVSNRSGLKDYVS